MRPGRPVAPFRPLVLPALALAAGIALGDASAVTPGLGLVGAAILLGPIWAAIRLRESYRCAICLPWLLLGLEVQSRAVFVDPRFDVGRLATLEGRLIALRGEVVCHPPGRRAGRYEIRARRVGQPWQVVQGRVIVYLPRVQGAGPGLGDRVELVGRLRVLTGSRNPGQFNTTRIFRSRGIRARMDLSSSGFASIRSLGPGGWWHPRRQIESVRTWLLHWSCRHLSPPADGLFRALLLGDRTGLTPECLDHFRRGGILHFLAISGLHVALAALGLGAVLRTAGVGRAGVASAVILALAWQCGLAGFRTPVVRAAVLAGGALVAPALVRAADSWNLMAGAALITLLLEPAELFTPGFALSYAAVAGILLFARRLDRSGRVVDLPGDPGPVRAFKRLVRAVLRSLAVTGAAWLGSGPLIWEWFGTFHPWVPVANLVVMPVFVGTLAAALVAAALAPLGPVALVPATLFSHLVPVLLLAARGVASLPGAAVAVPMVGIPGLAAWYGALALAHRVRGAWGTAAAAAVALGAIGWVWLAIPGAPDPDDDTPAVLRPGLTVLDVGQGLSVFLRAGDGATWLVDAGSTDDPDVADRVIRPFLRAVGVGALRGAILSHPDRDHQCGFPALARQGYVERIVSPTIAGVPRGVQHVPALEGWTEKRGCFGLTALHPPRAILEVVSGNDRSLVVRAELAGLRVLLPGDVEEAGLAHVNRVLEGPVDVMILPHHGGWADNLPEFLMRAKPELVVISARRSFPSSRTLRLLETMGIPCLATWRQGAITLSRSGDRLEVSTHVGLRLSLGSR